MIIVLSGLVLSLGPGDVASVVGSEGEYGFGSGDQLSCRDAVGPNMDHLQADTEFDADYNCHLATQITASMNKLEFFL